MAGDEQPVVHTTLETDRRPFEPPSEPSQPSDKLINPRIEVEPSTWTPFTTTVEVILSDSSGLHTTLEQVIFSTPPPQQQHGLATPHPVAHIYAQPSPLNHHLHPSIDSPGMTTLLVLAPLANTLIDHALTATTTPTPSTGTLTKPIAKAPHTFVTITRPHNISFARPTHIVEVNPQWPQVGTIVSESDIPERWRETYEMRELKIQYGALGAICGIFVLGVLGVIAVGWWKCWWHGECVCSRRRNKVNKQRFDWYG
ncbi:hypothetical protein BU25DRAFT_418712 [Macroventuria anomochaeta]|uniref:Uncharacterized protein n=1 Tax=Macroventuria anomochaeta TaxID=301207 RepID=A0ACB6SCK8_9PLEO|nr:uncharacterized protein BU25DRAFT_418712 [Macroventuria anomochaeta]KAF2631073.1 hypothetical protein BU25DRAFT_418712 [Macroventuria anomochaeta]